MQIGRIQPLSFKASLDPEAKGYIGEQTSKVVNSDNIIALGIVNTSLHRIDTALPDFVLQYIGAPRNTNFDLQEDSFVLTRGIWSRGIPGVPTGLKLRNVEPEKFPFVLEKIADFMEKIEKKKNNGFFIMMDDTLDLLDKM